jgi:tetratricopeptide (TPR) repeat protein
MWIGGGSCSGGSSNMLRDEHLIVHGEVDVEGMEWALQNLGDLYTDQGKLFEAEKMYIRALRGYEEALGPDHTSTLDTVHNLGNLYKEQGKLTEAEKMYTRALRGMEEALGPDHTSTLDTVNNLGLLYAGRCEARRRHLDRTTR